MIATSFEGCLQDFDLRGSDSAAVTVEPGGLCLYLVAREASSNEGDGHGLAIVVTKFKAARFDDKLVAIDARGFVSELQLLVTEHPLSLVGDGDGSLKQNLQLKLTGLVRLQNVEVLL